MTTIAFDGVTLASDSRQTANHRINPGNHQKIWRLSDGSLYTFAGLVSAGLKMLAFLQGEIEDQPEWEGGETTAVRISPKGHMYFYEGTGIWMVSKAKFNAWGSGEDFALGAMAAGANARDAIKIACKYDTQSGGAIRSLDLE